MIGLLLLIVFVVYVWIAVATTRFILKVTRSRVAGITSLVAFLLIPTWDTIWGTIQFNSLCKTEGGFNIVKTARATGFLDADEHHGCEGSCAEALTKLGFRFVEMDVTTPLWLTNNRGLHRFYIADSGSPFCVEFDKYVTKNNGHFYANVTLPKSRCVAGELITSVSAQYDVAIAKDEGVLPGPVKIERVESYVRDRRTGELLAKGTSFRSWGGWLINHTMPHVSATVCPLWKDSHGPIEEVLSAEGK